MTLHAADIARPRHGARTPPVPVYAPREVNAAYRADGTILLTSCVPLQGVRGSIVEYLEHWAAETPNAPFLSQRDARRDWQSIGYADALRQVQGIAEGIMASRADPDRPLMILTGASIAHALLMLGAMSVGMPVAPISPAYSTLPDARPRILEIADVLRPSLVFAEGLETLEGLRDIATIDAATWATGDGGDRSLALDGWRALTPGPDVARRRACVTPDTVAKILFTSGSTGAPKGVINTQRMLCSGIMSSALLVRSEQTPVQVDWMPWHHTMGGNTVLHGTLRTGGHLYIDDGRPTAEGIGRTLENIRAGRPTSMQSVPAAYAMLVAALEQDDDLRLAFFSRMERMIYAGASLPQDIWQRMQALSRRTIGREIGFGSGYGTTETGPGITITHWDSSGGGEIGLPLAGVVIKMVPVEDQYEVRVRGPAVTPGYYGRPDLTLAAFDDEGYYRVGDLVQFVDSTNPAAGLRFAGRLSENFKLTNGSWVATGPLRLAVLEVCQGLISDLVIAGADRDDIRILVWPVVGLGRADEATLADLATAIAERLRRFNAGGGATHRIAAFRILREPPSLGAGEITDKGYINQRGVLARRRALVADLYASDPPPDVVIVESPGARP